VWLKAEKGKKGKKTKELEEAMTKPLANLKERKKEKQTTMCKKSIKENKKGHSISKPPARKRKENKNSKGVYAKKKKKEKKHEKLLFFPRRDSCLRPVQTLAVLFVSRLSRNLLGVWKRSVASLVFAVLVQVIAVSNRFETFSQVSWAC
jgi:hypothetical protein